MKDTSRLDFFPFRLLSLKKSRGFSKLMTISPRPVFQRLFTPPKSVNPNTGYRKLHLANS